MTFLLYLGKVMLCSGILLGYYWLFLRNKRFHHYNRFYLQATLLVSVILPFLRIPVLYKPQDAVNQAVYQTIEVLTVNYGEEDGLGAEASRMAQWFTLENAGYLLYMVGVVVLLCMLAKSLLYIRSISKKYPFERISGLKFFTTREPGTPFSFFRSIFWSHELPFNSHDGQQIFRHELFHVQQKHSTDIILTEIVTAVFWFNPFFHILKKELKAIHEFLADHYAISNNDRYAYAELLVMQTLKANHIPITNHFFQNHIKRRITMITNKQSNRYSYGSRLMALPVLALLFCSIALYAQRSTNGGRTIYYTGSDKAPITVVIDAGHGGSDPGAPSKDGKVKEKDLALQISQKIQQLAPSYNVKVVMTRTDDNLPGGTTDKNEGLKARTALAEKIKSDMYISIHISHSDQEGPYSGFEVWVSNKENERTNQSKLLGAALTQELSKLYTTNKTLKQRTTNIWVLEQTPCPAVLIECGYIDNDKDLAFISNSSNQEAIAKKILEGIVNAKNKPAAAVTAPATTPEPIATAAPVKRSTPVVVTSTTMAATSTIATQAAVVTDPAFEENMMKALERAAEKNRKRPVIIYRSAPFYQEVPKPAMKDISIDPKDPVVSRLAAHYCRNLRYPKLALSNNAEGVIYFSISVDANGVIDNLQLYNEAPAEVKEINKLIVVSYSNASNATTAQASKEEVIKAMQEEIKKTSERKANLSGHTPLSTQYFFQVKFNLEVTQTATT
jgi:N-acetylmuramoyl-L-alanine amidase